MPVCLFSNRSESVGNPPSEPGVPVVVRVKGTSVSLDWTAPDGNGGLRIIGYIIKYGVAGSTADQYDTQEVKQATTTYRLSGKLQAKTSYRFAVAAKNKAGEGPFSDYSEPIRTNTGNYLRFKSDMQICCYDRNVRLR